MGPTFSIVSLAEEVELREQDTNESNILSRQVPLQNNTVTQNKNNRDTVSSVRLRTVEPLN